MSEQERPDPYAQTSQPTLRDLVSRRPSSAVVGGLFAILGVVVVGVVVVAVFFALLA